MATPQTTTNKPKTYPVTDPHSHTPNTGVWTWSTRTNLVPASTITSDYIIAGVAIRPEANVPFEIELGYGATPTVLGTMPGNVLGSQGSGWFFVPWPIPQKADANSQLQIRMRKSGTSGTAWYFKLLYYEFDSGNMNYSNEEVKVIPEGETGISLANPGTEWVFSNWERLDNLTDGLVNITVLGISVDSTSTRDFEIELGVGENETDVVTFAQMPWTLKTPYGPNCFLPFGIPIKKDGANDYWARIRSNSTSGTLNLKMVYVSNDALGTQAIEYTTQPLKCAPNPGPFVIAVPGENWSVQAWEVALSSMPTDGIVIAGHAFVSQGLLEKNIAGLTSINTEENITDMVELTEFPDFTDNSFGTIVPARTFMFPVEVVPGPGDQLYVGGKQDEADTDQDDYSHAVAYYEQPL